MKEAYYFPHDANARTDAKILELRAELGWEGYGLWWALVEQLREATDYRLSNEKTGGLAMGLNIQKKQLEGLLALCFDLGLLELEDGHFFAPALRRRMEPWDAKRAALSEAGKRGAGKRWNDKPLPDAPEGTPQPPQCPPDSQAIATPLAGAIAIKEKERKEEESKEDNSSLRSEPAADAAASGDEKKIGAEELQPESPAPADASASHTRGAADVGTRKAFVRPTQAQVLAYMLTRRPNNPAPIPDEAERWMNYYQSNGWKVGRTPMQDWEAACRNWLTKVPKDAPGTAVGYALPPQPFGTAYGRPQQASQVSIRTAAIAQADALVDAMAGSYKPYDLTKP